MQICEKNSLNNLQVKKPIEILLSAFFNKRQTTTSFVTSTLYLCIKNKEMVANMKSIGKGIAEIKESKFVDFNKKFETINEFLEAIHNTRAGIFESEISSVNLFTYIKSIIESNQEFSFIKQVHQMNLDISDKIIYLELIWNKITGKENIKVLEILSGVFDTAIKCFMYIQGILGKENQLVNQKFVEITVSHYINEIEITLSDTSLELLKEEGIKQFANNKKKE